MRAPSFLSALAGLLLAPASPALAIPVELTFTGSLTEVPDVYRSLGLAGGDPIKGTLIYESDTPSITDRGGASGYHDPFLGAWVRLGQNDAYTLGGRDGCCDKITVATDRVSFNIALEDSPDLMRFETLAFDIDPGGPIPYAFRGPLPTTLSAKEFDAPGRQHRIFGGATDPDQAGTTRLSLLFDLARVDIRPFEGDLDKLQGGDRPQDPKTPPVPEPGTALLLGLGLAGLAGRSRANA